nr:MAG TPA: hypothetical protein [Caudoviricetes sp.]
MCLHEEEIWDFGSLVQKRGIMHPALRQKMQKFRRQRRLTSVVEYISHHSKFLSFLRLRRCVVSLLQLLNRILPL